MLTVKCPRCLHDQLYRPLASYIVGKRKACVYCGKSFSIHADMEKTNVVCLGKRAEFNAPLM